MTQRKLYRGPLTDNARWDMIDIRPDDVFVVTPPKCGTTWMQTIVALLFSGDPDIETDVSTKMPWIDIRFRDLPEIVERLESMRDRRSMKSHTPMDGLPIDEHAQYICVFRHPLDAHFSFRNHVRNIPINLLDEWYPQEDANGATFHHFLNGGADGFDCDAMPLAHILRHYKAAKALSDRPNVSLFHFADMKRDLANVFAEMAELLGISHADIVMERLVRAAGFHNMKQNAERYAPGGGTGFYKSDSAFFRGGVNGQWRGKLTSEELAAYDAMMNAHLDPPDRAWLEHGSVPEVRC